MQKEILKNFNREGGEFLCVSLSLSDVTSFILMMMMIRTCAILHIRIANRVVKDSCCRGGSVNIRGVFSCARSVRPERSKALWRFRASTSNSPSGRTRDEKTLRRFLNENPKFSSSAKSLLTPKHIRTHSSIKRTRDTHTNSSMSSSLAGGGGGGNGGFLGGMRGLTKFVEKIRNCANQV